MVKKESRFDVFSILIGILLSLIANGIYDAIFYWATGKILEELVVVVIVFMVVTLVVVIALSWLVYRVSKNDGLKKPKKESSDSLPTHDQLRIAILTFLYRKSENSSLDGVVGLQELYDILNIDKNIVQFDLRYLEDEKLIESVALLNNYHSVSTGPIRITSAGINVIEHKEQNISRLPFLSATIPIYIQTKFGIINL